MPKDSSVDSAANANAVPGEMLRQHHNTIKDTMLSMNSSSQDIFLSKSEPPTSTQQAKDTMPLKTLNSGDIFVSNSEPLASTQQADGNDAICTF